MRKATPDKRASQDAKQAGKTALEQYGELVLLVRDNPMVFLGCGELAIFFRVPDEYVTAANKAKDTPFIGKNCRPDRLSKWFDDHGGMTT